MPLQHLQFLAVLQADQVIRRYRLANRDGRLQRLRFGLDLLAVERAQRGVNRTDHLAQLLCWKRIVAHIRGDHVCGHPQQLFIADFRGCDQLDHYLEPRKIRRNWKIHRDNYRAIIGCQWKPKIVSIRGKPGLATKGMNLSIRRSADRNLGRRYSIRWRMRFFPSKDRSVQLMLVVNGADSSPARSLLLHATPVAFHNGCGGGNEA
jgi:hypothetical protein